MKLGFDIHGVIDTFAAFPALINNLLESDIEIHVITGLARAEAEEQIGHLIDLTRVKYFSVTDYLESRDDVEVTWIDGLPWADETAWNNSKADYCAEQGIDMLFDDSPTYARTFENISTLYCQVHNPNRVQYRDRINTQIGK